MGNFRIDWSGRRAWAGALVLLLAPTLGLTEPGFTLREAMDMAFASENTSEAEALYQARFSSDEALDPPSVLPETLSLADALTLALTNNPELQVSALEPQIAGAVVDRERAGWDPSIVADVGREDVKNRATSSLDGISVQQTEDRDASLRFVKPLPSGGDLQAGIEHSRAATNSQRAILNPTYRTALSVAYNRPLLRGSGRDSTGRSLALAEVDFDVANWELRRMLLQTLADTEQAYWQLAAAQERVEVAKLNLRSAELLLKRSGYRVEAGTLAGVALTEAEAAVAERRDLLLVAERNRQVAHNALMAQVDPPPRPGHKLPPLSDIPGRGLPEAPAFLGLVRQALAQSPGYRGQLAALRSRRVELAFSRDAFQPRLDLVASMRANGVGGGTSQAFGRSVSADFPGYFVGLQFQVPVGRRAARAESRRRALELERALRSLKATELRLEGDVMDRIQRYEIDLQRVEVSGGRVDAARRKLDAEEARFDGGLIAADDVLRFQADLAIARGAEVEARAQASVSAMDLWRVSGTLLEKRGVVPNSLGLPVGTTPTQ